jgi:hypothetical protein
MRGLERGRRSNPVVRSASLSRAADLNLDREQLRHESHDKDHKQILPSAPLRIAGAFPPGFPSEALVLHLALALSDYAESYFSSGILARPFSSIWWGPYL